MLNYHLKRGNRVLQAKDQLERIPSLQAPFSSCGQLASKCCDVLRLVYNPKLLFSLNAYVVW